MCGKPAVYKTAQLCRIHYVYARRATETPEEHENRKTTLKLRQRKARGKTEVRVYGQPKEIAEAKRKLYFKEYNAAKRKAETPEQTEARRAKTREYNRKRRGSPALNAPVRPYTTKNKT